MLTETIPLNLHFKGQRTYITGADIAQGMLNYIGVCTKLRIEFHHMAACALSMHEVLADQLPSMKQRDDVYAWLAATDAEGVQRYWLAQAQTRATQVLRLGYDESVFTRHALLEDKRIHADVASMQASPVDALVALNKYLLNQCVEVHPWIFVRLDMQHWPFDSSGVQIQLTGQASHGIHKTTILSHGVVVGHIYFTRSATT
jgi:hypothetical protein